MGKSSRSPWNIYPPPLKFSRKICLQEMYQFQILISGGLYPGIIIWDLNRFIGRRGQSHTIFSDNSLNFREAEKEITDHVSKFNFTNVNKKLMHYQLS